MIRRSILTVCMLTAALATAACGEGTAGSGSADSSPPSQGDAALPEPSDAAQSGTPDAAATSPDASAESPPDSGSGEPDAGTLPANCRRVDGAILGAAIASQAGRFEATWDVTPGGANLDAAIGMLRGGPGGGIAFATSVRFFTGGVIDARNGGEYASLTTIPYVAGTTYRIRQVVDVPAHTYSAFVRPSGGVEVQLARDYAFRTEHQSVPDLDHWVVGSLQGELTACLVSLQSSGVSVRVSPAAVSLQTSATQQFTAQVSGATNTDVTWSVVGTGCGAISSTGLYTAPAAAASCRVRATSAQEAQAFGEATVSITAPPQPGVLPAFPGAEGGGALSKGGRGGAVIEVTTLSDSGPGSLRACIDASGPRTCVFRVGGTIELQSYLYVDSPFLTVAGQTAPGDGIQISGKNMTYNVVYLDTHDIVWRYTRVRKGHSATYIDERGALMPIGGIATYGVIVDHNSMYWNEDENMSAWSGVGRSPKDVTFSWNIAAEGLAIHSTMAITGGSGADLMTDIDWHHNYTANFSHRCPLLKHKSGRFINNLVYNCRRYQAQIGGGLAIDLINNHWKLKPGSTNLVHEIDVFPNGSSETAPGAPSIYVAGNLGRNSSDPSADNWASMVRKIPGENQEGTNGANESALDAAQYRRNAPLAPRGVAITVDPAERLPDILFAHVGASRRLDCRGGWVSIRDAADARVIGDFTDGGGTVITTEDEVGGFPALSGGTPCPDGDHDGMPDAWESAVLAPAKTSLDPNGTDFGDGYTNLEHYLNGMNPLP